MDNPTTTKCDSETGANITQPASAERHFRELVAKSLNQCRRVKDRHRVTSELNTLTNLGITKRMLDDWASPGKKGLRFPASLVKAFCQVTGDDTLALAVIPEPLKDQLAVGKWAVESRWILDKISVEIGKHVRQDLRKNRTLKRAVRRNHQ